MTASTLPQFGGDRAINPAKFYAEWNGRDGHLFYTFKDADGNWKDAQGNKNMHVFSDQFTFVYLASFNTVKGFSDEDQNGFYANEVRDVRYEPLVVKCGQRVAAKGLWAEIRADLKTQGAKFCKSIYIGFKDSDDTIQIGNIQATGAFMASWFDFVKRHATERGAIRIIGTEDRKKGSVDYKVPKFKAVKVADETLDQSAAKLKELKEYLDEYFDRGSVMLADESETDNGHSEDPFGTIPLPQEDETAADVLSTADDIPW